MDATEQLATALKNGETVKLVIGRDESINNAHAYFNRLEREHNLSIGRMPAITAEGIALIAWSVEHGQNPMDAGLLRKGGRS